MISDFDIICISTSNWEYPWGSRQQIMSRLSSKNRVLFIEYQMSILHFLKYPGLFFKNFTHRLRNINDNLIVYKPLVNLPFRYYSKVINLLNQELLLLQLKRLIKQLRFSKTLLWIFEPTSYFLVGRLKEQISIYHCIDFFKNEKKLLRRKKCIEDMEEELCKKCNVIFTSTDELLTEKVKLNKQTYLIPSAVSESLFGFYKNYLSIPIPKIIKRIPRPRIGFVGILDDRIDYELIDFMAREQYDWTIVLIGLFNKGDIIKHLRQRKNIHVLGWIDNNLLPVYINSFDVGIIPYKINEFTKGISPIKVFEYLALGKPVVATDLPALRALNINGLIKIAKSKQDYLECIKDYLINDTITAKNFRIEFAKANTWQNRTDSISKILNNYMHEIKNNKNP